MINSQVRELKDYKGYKVLKETDLNTGSIYYWLNDQDDNNINIYRSLKELKNDVDTVWNR